jgi:octaprenyl-diphosphate synthase
MRNIKQEIIAKAKNDLEGIETALRENLNPHLDLIRETAGHILFSGGKRLRPLLMLLSARLCGYTGNEDKNFSAIFEYLHAASLLHDDIVDGAALRRGKPVAHSIWGSTAAVLVGDFLLARSLSLAVKARNMKVIEVISEITEQMSRGELHQLVRKGDTDLSEAEYMEIIRCKTAVLISAACRVGSLIAGAGEPEEAALAEYGLNMGIAFQMADDLLDYTADSKTLGKEVGADLKEGKLTLPVIYSLKAADPETRVRMTEIIKNKNFSVQSFETLVNILKSHGGIKYTEQKAAEHISGAKAALSIFDKSKTKEILLHIADYALKRKM